MPETTSSAVQTPQISGEHRELLDQILDKWSLLVLDTLCESPRRFNELRRAGNQPEKTPAEAVKERASEGAVRAAAEVMNAHVA